MVSHAVWSSDGWWRLCRRAWWRLVAVPAAVAALVRPQDELVVFQTRLLAAVQGAARRTLAGTICFPTAALVRLHPADLPLFQGLRSLVQAELDTELRRRTEGIRGARFDGCRVTAQADPDVPRRCPVVRVDWLPATELLPPAIATRPLPAAGVGAGVVSVPVATRPPRTGAGDLLVTERAEAAPALRPGPDTAWLVVREGAPGDLDRRVPLPPVAGDTLTIGRQEGQRLRLGGGDARISSRHAVIRLEGGRWVVEDLCSTNGTYVDGVRITGPAPLGASSVIRVGRTELGLETDAEPRRRPKHAAEPVPA